jgi:hypothetical protein
MKPFEGDEDVRAIFCSLHFLNGSNLLLSFFLVIRFHLLRYPFYPFSFQFVQDSRPGPTNDVQRSTEEFLTFYDAYVAMTNFFSLSSYDQKSY